MKSVLHIFFASCILLYSCGSNVKTGNQSELLSIKDLEPFVFYHPTSINNCTAEGQPLPQTWYQLRNTKKGLVVYDTFSSNTVYFSTNYDTLHEWGGHERMDFVLKKDSLNNMKFEYLGQLTTEGSTMGYVKIKFSVLDPETFTCLYERIWSLDSTRFLEKKLLLRPTCNTKDLVFIKEPSPHTPGTEIPFIDLDFSKISFASLQDFIR